MSGSGYFAFLHKALDLYRSGRFAEAYDLVLLEGEKVGGNQAQILNLRYCLESLLGRREEALRTFRRSVESGYWYGYDYLLQDEDLRSIRDEPEFRELAEVCRHREAQAKQEARPTMELLPPENLGDVGWPTVMALHGNGDSVHLTRGFWEPSVDEGFALALPQSAQVTSWGMYTWNDLEKGRKELLMHVRKLVESGIREHQLVLGGFSGGGRLALYSMLQGDVSPKGFILMAPWFPEIEEWRGMIAGLGDCHMSGFILCGEKDEQCLANALLASEMLNQAGIGTEVQVIPGLEHDFPEDFGKRLKGMLASFR